MTAFTIRARDLIVASDRPLLHDVAVVVVDGTVVAVEPWSTDAATGVIVEADGVLSPGFVDAHSHLRGLPLADHGVPARQFESWICSLGAAASLDPEDEAFVASTELLETGVTAVQGFVDPGAAGEPLEAPRSAVAGVQRSGIRALVVLGFADRALHAPEPAEGEWQAIPAVEPAVATARVADLARAWLATDTHPGVRLGIGPIGAHWSTDALIAAIAASAGTARLHTHLYESHLHRHWLGGEASPLDRLDDAGMLGPLLSGAHAVHLTPSELDRIAACGASLVHCPASNEALMVGRARVRDWHERGIPSGLGVDSQNTAKPDYFDVMRSALATSASVGGPISTGDVFAMATTGGSTALGITNGGTIAVGSPADFISIDAHEASVDSIVRSAVAADVRQAWVAGNLVVSEGSSVADAGSVKQRLRSQLLADSDERARRRESLSATVDMVERLAKGMP